MKAFATQVCFGVCVLLVGCGGDDEAPSATASGGAGGTGGGASTTTTGGSGGEAGGSGGEAGSAGAPECDSPPTENELEIAGAYRDNWDTSHRIDDEVWEMGTSTFTLIDFSNDEGWAIVENGADNEFFAESFSRFEWTRKNGQLFYCQSVYASSTAEEAQDEPRADASDLVTGCGASFAWSSLTPMALVGDYEDQYEGSHTITPSFWLMGSSVFHLLEFSNGQRWAVAQNDCDNSYFPGKYSRFDWMVLGGGEGGAAGAAGAAAEGPNEAYFCQTGYDLDSAEAARELEAADTADLANGCSGYPWSKLSAQDL